MSAGMALWLRTAAVLAAAMVAGSASGEVVQITLDLDVQKRFIGSFPGIDDPSFVPFSSSASLSFDGTWTGTFTGSPGSGFNETVSSFAANNQFTSALSSLLPWGPPASDSTDVEYDRAIYVYAQFDEPVDGVQEHNYLFWDKRFHFNDVNAKLEYRYGISLDSNSSPFNPISSEHQDFQTDDLLRYLMLLKQEQIPLIFNEYGIIYDYDAHQTVAFLGFQASATITDLAAPSLVPVPPAIWLLGSAVGLLVGIGRKVRALPVV